MAKTNPAKYLAFSQHFSTNRPDEYGTVSGPRTYMAHGTRVRVVRQSGTRVLLAARRGGKTYYGWDNADNAVGARKYQSIHGAAPEGNRVTNPRSLPTRFIPAKFKTRSGIVSGEVRRNPKNGRVQIRVNPTAARKLSRYARRANSAEDYPGFGKFAYSVYWGINSPKWPMANGYYRTKKEAMERAKLERRRTGHKYAVKKVPHNP